MRTLATASSVDRQSIRQRGAELLGKVSLDADVLRRYPHELSGGMRQRVAIALALSLEPRLIVFDEPTTALDVIVQNAVMDTIKQLQREQQFTALLISHDLGVVLEATDRVLVMYAGEIVEDQPSDALLRGSAPPVHRGAARLLRRSARRRGASRRHRRLAAGPVPSTCRAARSRRAAAPSRTSVAQQIPPLTPLGKGTAACHVRAREHEEATHV